MRFIIAPLVLLAMAGSTLAQAQEPSTPVPAAAQGGGEGPAPGTPRVLKFAVAPRPAPLTPWRAPNRPHTRLADILKAHDGKASWSQTVVRDGHFTGSFIQMAPGEKSKALLYSDTEMFWVVQSGQMRVTIQGLEPFVASRRFVVQVPAHTMFQMETLGDAPVLRFEVTHTGALPVYAADEKPLPVKGQRYVRIAYAAPAARLDPATVYLDFENQIIAKNGRTTRFLKSGSLIRGASIATPGREDLGHWHTETNEFYFVMEGALDYQLEGTPPFVAEQGDVVYVPHGRHHRNNFVGGGMGTRLAVFPTGQINLLDPENPSKQAP